MSLCSPLLLSSAAVVQSSSEVRDKQIVRLLGKVPALAAYAYHRSTGRKPSHPNQHLNYAENFLYMLDSLGSPNYKPNPKLARALVRPAALGLRFLCLGFKSLGFRWVLRGKGRDWIASCSALSLWWRWQGQRKERRLKGTLETQPTPSIPPFRRT